MLSAREYAKMKGVEFVGKLKMSYEWYGMGKKQKVWTDEAGNKFYPGISHPTIVLVNGKIL